MDPRSYLVHYDFLEIHVAGREGSIVQNVLLLHHMYYYLCAHFYS